MDLVKTVSNVLGVVCVIIGVLLVPLGIWFLRPGIKNKDSVSLIVSILILALAVGTLIGAYVLFTQGILKQAPIQ
jgi:drug/metabolite transporter (DMT)-like permease